MDKSTLSSLVKDALNAATSARPVYAPLDDLPNFKLSDYLDIPEEHLKKIDDAITQTPDLSVFDGGAWLQFPLSGSRIEVRYASSWLLIRAHAGEDISDLVDRLYDIATSRTAMTLTAMAVKGITVLEKINLGNGYELWPFNKMPPCWGKELFSPQHHSPIYNIDTTASAAIVFRTERKILFKASDNAHLNHPEVTEADPWHQENLREVRRALTLVGPSAPIDPRRA